MSSSNNADINTALALDQLFLHGIAAFNQQRYFECHEWWEALWNQLDEPTARNYVQGLLQIAVSLHHVQSSNRTGANSLFQKGQERLSGLHQQHCPQSIQSIPLAWVNLTDCLQAVENLLESYAKPSEAHALKWPILLIIPN